MKQPENMPVGKMAMSDTPEHRDIIGTSSTEYSVYQIDGPVQDDMSLLIAIDYSFADDNPA